ncbi:hypothetical protein [Roseovarius sp.]|uniref:hypothetical protein n=1 Tax=Roseovarius sp. TaxID=1486281 RepID=UPI003A9827C3
MNLPWNPVDPNRQGKPPGDKSSFYAARHARRMEKQARKRERKVSQRIIFAAARRRASLLRRLRRTHEPRDALLSLIHYKEVLTTTLLTIVSAGIALLTYSGLSSQMIENGGGIADKGHALSVATIIGTISFLSWSFTFGLVHWLTGKALAVAMAAAMTLILSIAAIDAQYNMLGLSGPAAVQLSLVDTSAHYEAQRRTLSQTVGQAQQLVPALNAQAARFEALKIQEELTGAFSGRKGPGKVSEAFGQIANLLTSLSGDIERGAAKAGSMQTEITRGITQLKSHVYSLGNVRDRSRDVSSSADRLDELFGNLAQYDYRASLLATIASLDSLTLSGGAATSEFGAVQNAELAAISEMAKPVATSLRAALEGIASPEVATSTVSRPMSAMAAVRHYWFELLPAWIAAFAIDLLPALLVIILIAARREAAKTGSDSGETK